MLRQPLQQHPHTPLLARRLRRIHKARRRLSVPPRQYGYELPRFQRIRAVIKRHIGHNAAPLSPPTWLRAGQAGLLLSDARVYPSPSAAASDLPVQTKAIPIPPPALSPRGSQCSARTAFFAGGVHTARTHDFAKESPQVQVIGFCHGSLLSSSHFVWCSSVSGSPNNQARKNRSKSDESAFMPRRRSSYTARTNASRKPLADEAGTQSSGAQPFPLRYRLRKSSVARVLPSRNA